MCKRARMYDILLKNILYYLHFIYNIDLYSFALLAYVTLDYCCITEYLKQIIRTQDTSNLILHDLNQRISRIEDIMRGHAPISIKDNSRIKEDIMRNFVHVSIKNDNPMNPITEILPLQTVESIRDDSLIVETLPLQTVEQIRDFDLLLQENDEAVTQFVSLY